MDLKKGGFCQNPMNFPSEVNNLQNINPLDPILASFYNTIFLTRLALKGKAAVFSYLGGPFTIFAYMVEKSRSGLLETTKKWIYNQTEESHKILEFLNENLYIHTVEQIKAGAQIIGIFEVFTDLIAEDFNFLSYYYLKKLILRVKKEFPQVPIIIYAKGQNAFMKKKLKEAEKDEDLPFDGIILDHNCDLEEMSELCEKKHKVIVGNLDPGVLMGSEKIIQEKTEKMIKKRKEMQEVCCRGRTRTF